jgi:hypothetical protein
MARADPDHRRHQQHVEREQAVGPERGRERRAQQRIDQRLAVVEGAPAVIAHQDDVVGGNERELLEQPVDVADVETQVVIVRQGQRHQVVGGLVRLEVDREAGLGEGERQQDQEHREREEGQARAATHGAATVAERCAVEGGAPRHRRANDRLTTGPRLRATAG